MKYGKIIITTFLGNLLLGLGFSAFAQEIIAHRGASYLAPENTLSSVKLGYALGADAVEVDIHLTKDGQIVVNHDRDTKRTAQGKNLVIAETDTKALRKLDVGSWKDEKYKGEKMPFLQEVLAVVPEGKTLVIEVKSGPEILPYLKEEIEKSKIRDRLALISFNKDVVIQGKQKLPSIPVFWLLHTFQKYPAEEAIKIAKENRLAGLDVNYRLIDAGFMRQMDKAGLKVYAYTVDNPLAARALKALNVDGITTNRPQWMREELSK